MKMMIIWISVMILSEMHSEVVDQPDPVMVVSVGDRVTLRCFFLKDHSDPITWYKQIAGHRPQAVLMTQKYAKKPSFYNNFEASHFSIEMDTKECNLTILNVTSSDEAMYYCGWRKYETYFSGGTYVALKGSQNRQDSTVSVVQHPVSQSVHSGDAVTLLCSFLTELDTTDFQMFWLRYDSEKSVPEMLYTQDRTNRLESDFPRSCTFNLSRNIVSQRDTGTYYCAVVTCGKILLGNGMKINMIKSVDPLVIILSVSLVICVVIIIAQVVLSYKKKRYWCNKEKHSRETEKERVSSKDPAAGELSYAALHFKTEKHRRGHRKAESPQDSVYSQTMNNHDR